MKHELGTRVWVRCPSHEVRGRQALLREGPALREEMDVKTNRINMQSSGYEYFRTCQTVLGIVYGDTIICSKSMKKCTAVTNTKLRIVLTPGGLWRAVELGAGVPGDVVFAVFYS